MSHRLLQRCSIGALLASQLVTSTALAGSAEEEARRLFEEGAAAERAGKPEACTKFRESLATVREIGPLSKVKDCDLREGKLVSGEANLRELVARWPQPGPELDALKTELAAVEQRVPHLTLKLRSGAPLGISVRLDGTPVDFPVEHRAVDPGKHELLVDVPSRPLDRLSIELGEGESKTIELPALVVAPVVPAPAPAEAGLGALGISGVVVGALGIGGFVGAGVTGKLVLDKQDEFEAAQCGADGLPDAASCSAIASDGETLLIANGVLWGVGIAGVAVGATLLIIDLASGPSGASTEPSAPKATVGLRPGYAELTITF